MMKSSFVCLRSIKTLQRKGISAKRHSKRHHQKMGTIFSHLLDFVIHVEIYRRLPFNVKQPDGRFFIFLRHGSAPSTRLD